MSEPNSSCIRFEADRLVDRATGFGLSAERRDNATMNGPNGRTQAQRSRHRPEPGISCRAGPCHLQRDRAVGQPGLFSHRVGDLPGAALGHAERRIDDLVVLNLAADGLRLDPHHHQLARCELSLVLGSAQSRRLSDAKNPREPRSISARTSIGPGLQDTACLGEAVRTA